jgi:hypothetical protein
LTFPANLASPINGSPSGSLTSTSGLSS